MSIASDLLLFHLRIAQSLKIYKEDSILLPYSFYLQWQDIFQKMQMWKLVPAIFAFSSTPELIFGLYLLYYFRIFERQIGSNKFLVSDFLCNNVE